MRKMIERAKKMGTGIMLFLFSMQSMAITVLAADIDVEGKISTAADTIKGILTGVVGVVGICVSLFIIIKRMPDADNPHEKHELYRGVGRVWGLVALAAACIWVIPWVYNLFT